MIVRACFLAFALSCSLIGGCCVCDTVGIDPPGLKFCNLTRLGQEIGWLYADVQDTVFGVDYYYDIDHEFDSGPYSE